MRVKVGIIGLILLGAIIYAVIHFVHNANDNLSAAIPTNTSARSGAMNYGIAAGGGLTSDSPAVLNRRLATMQALGVGWVRFDFSWAIIQPKNSISYNWTITDRAVEAATAHHLKILGIIDNTPAWARVTGCTSPHCQPASPAAFGKFSGSVAAHYAHHGVHDWEIENEENLVTAWLPMPNVATYAQILKSSFISIQKADSSAFVLIGGLSSGSSSTHYITPNNFVNSLYADGSKNFFDGIAIHPYSYPKLPTANDPNGPFALRKVVVAHGDSAKPIWITEIGAPTDGPDHSYVTESFQTKILTTSARLYNQPWLGPLFWFSDTDMGSSKTTSEDFFGLVAANGQHKPAYNSLKAITSGN